MTQSPIDGRVAVFVVPTDYDALARKGVLHMIAERAEDGFFDRVLTVHPFAVETRRIDHDARNVVYEFAAPEGGPVPEGPIMRALWRVGAWTRRLGHLWRMARFLKSLQRRHGVALVRAQDPYFCGLIAWLATRRPRVPFCISIHSDYDKRYALDGADGAPVIFGSRKLAKRLESFLYARADMVLPHFPSRGEIAVRAGAPRARVRLFAPGIDMTPFRRAPLHDPLADLGIANDAKTVVFAGRLSNENYVDEMLDLARRLGPSADFRLILVGGGSEEARLRAAVESDPVLARHVVLAGFRPHAWVCDLRRVATVSLCLMGGFSLIEACAAARPVVAFDVEWHADLVRDGESGFLIREGDIDALVDAVRRLLDDPALCADLGARAREIALALFDRDRTKLAHRALYAELIERRSAAA